MLTNSFKFFGILLASLLVVGLVHYFILIGYKINPNDVLFLRSYLLNAFLAQLIFIVLDFLKNRKSNSLGFVFMGGSMVKFAAFFIFFYPYYTANGNTDKIEFLAFFIPYGISLILEAYTLVKILNKS